MESPHSFCYDPVRLRHHADMSRTNVNPGGLHASSCRHQRLVDRVLTDSGTETGQVRCLECGAIIADQPSPQWQEVLTQRPFVQS
ncbi:MAG: hypothetical protein DYH04_14390 [Nitrospira sp. NTP2]|nr:hypothetical protein [Nitrospira sp. NTP2]